MLLVDENISNELNSLKCYDGINCIMCNKNNLQDKINYIIDQKNRIEINEIRKKGMENSLLNHSVDKRVEYLSEIIKKIEIDRK